MSKKRFYKKRGNFGVGMAAGMEYDDSGDEFMFGDDDFDEPPKPKQVLTSAATISSQQRKAPWMNQGNAANNDDGQRESEKQMHANVTEQRTEVNLEDENIRVAIMKGDVDFMQKAFNAGYDVNRKVRAGWTGIMYAANFGHPDVIKLFIDNGANVNFQKDMFTPLMALCSATIKEEQNLVESLKFLLTANARVNAHDRHLITPLMYASQNGRAELVQTLIDHNADIDCQDNRGWTPLAFAASSGHTNVVKALLRNNAKHTLCDFSGQSPADLAYSAGFTSLADTLENQSSNAEKGEAVSRSAQASNNSANSKYVTYGDLEIFLCGIGLEDLVTLFQEHRLSFEEFLRITDAELIQIGVTQLGVRRKILEAIRGAHTNEWDYTGLTVDNTSKLSTLEAAAIVANIAKHLTCIQSSVTYLQNFVRENNASINKDDPATQAILVQQCKDASNASVQLQHQMDTMHKTLVKELPRAFEKQCDFVDDKQVVDAKGKKLITVVSVVLLLSVASGLGYQITKRLSSS